MEGINLSRSMRTLGELLEEDANKNTYDSIQSDIVQLNLTEHQREGILNSLAVLDEPSPTNEQTTDYLSSPELSPLQKQRMLETLAVEKQVLDYRKNKKELEQMGLAANLSPAQRVVLKWLEPMLLELQSRMCSTAAEDFAPVLNKLEPEQIAVIVIHETLSSTLKAASKGVTFVRLAKQLGEAVVAQLHLNDMRASKQHLFRFADNVRLCESTRGVQILARRCGLEAPDTVRCLELGAWLLRVLMDTAFVPKQPTLAHLSDLLGEEQQYSSRGARQQQQSSALPYQQQQEESDEEAHAFEEDDDEEFGGATYGSDDDELAGRTVDLSEQEVCSQLRDSGSANTQLFMRMFGDFEPNSVLEPAFERLIVRTGKSEQRVGVIRCRPALYSYVEEGHADIEPLNTRHQPMLIPPLNWLAPDLGCYLLTTKMPNRIQMMRTKGSVQKQPLQDPTINLETTYRALDILSSLPWKINTDILRIQEEAWAEGGGIAEIPSTKEIPLPEPLPLEQQQDPALMRQWRKEYKKKLQLSYDAHGLRCCFRYQLKVAQDFRSLPAIYFPHNVDFRGRAYPIPPHLNHMGADVCRGLLVFAEAKPLGPNGLDWLRIHLCNLFGNNKMPFADRQDFVHRNIHEVFDSAKKPLAGRRWWAKAEDPWQALATCIEITRALESGDPASYMSHLPVHADGSCNGLQHYAALGGDTFGATQVNLYPAERPMDVYSGVSDLVAERVRQDAADPTSPNHEYALLLNGKIQRRTIKQTVMTKVYGVTRPGARLQIENAMEDLGTLPEDLPDRDKLMWKCSNYIASLTFDALKSMFSGATTIMEWLKKCAGAVASRHEPVSWLSPIGLPIIQHYTRPSRRSIKTIVQRVSLEDEGNRISVNRQRSAFPPNFVHSLDSSHMFFTALRMHQEGLPFASVHDSYWTHPCNMHTMSRLLREEFVRLHSQPLLQNLHDHLHAVHPSIELPDVPERGDFDLKHVLNSPYFFH